MAEFFEDLDGARPTRGSSLLDEVFHLEDQLATHSTHDAREVT